MDLGALILLMFCVLVIAVLAVSLTRKTRQGTTKPTRFRPALPGQVQLKEASMDSGKVDLFLIEHVPADMKKLPKGGFEASAKVQAELVEAGEEVRRKVPGSFHDPLNCPVDGDLTALLSQGVNPNELTPELVRTSVAVAEASLALWEIMLKSSDQLNHPCYQVELGEPTGILVVGNKLIYGVSDVIARISRGTGVPHGIAIAMWEAIVKILREGSVNIPGLKAAQRPVQTSEKE